MSDVESSNHESARRSGVTASAAPRDPTPCLNVLLQSAISLFLQPGTLSAAEKKFVSRRAAIATFGVVGVGLQ